VTLLKFDAKGFMAGTSRFFREVRSELRKVLWPKPKDVAVYTLIVVGASVFISSLMWIVDSVLSQGLALIIK
jgi:preprotein translocase subunit SecE